MRKTRRKIRKNTRKNTRAWGYHLIVDASHCEPHQIRSKTVIAAFVKELVKAIDMVAYGAPKIVRFGSDRLLGYTLVQLIETSDITAHFDEDNNAAYFDLFSCKRFDPKVPIRIFDKYFQPTHKKIKFFKRQA